MIHLKFETHGALLIKRENISDTEIKLHFYGKNYKTNPDDHVIIKDIYYNDLHLNELIAYSTMTTDNTDYAYLTAVDYISFNGTWHLHFTDDDVKAILKRKLT